MPVGDAVGSSAFVAVCASPAASVWIRAVPVSSGVWLGGISVAEAVAVAVSGASVVAGGCVSVADGVKLAVKVGNGVYVGYGVYVGAGV